MNNAKEVPLKACFPWMGGKARVADAIWERIGDVDNYIEPFAGSIAILLRRPVGHFAKGYRVETINDANHYLVNVWRSITHAPSKVAEYADWIVSEADLHARHEWLVRSQESADFRRRMKSDPNYYDPMIAGYWIWGACAWIGSGWCDDADAEEPTAQIVDLSGGFGRGMGVHARALSSQVPELCVGRGVLAASHTPEKIPHMDAVGRGRHGRPQLTDAYDIGRGVNGGATELSKRLPMISGTGDGVYAVAGAKRVSLHSGRGEDAPAAYEGACEARRKWLIDWMHRLSDRLRLVRSCYGHWSRVCDSESTLTRLDKGNGVGVVLDPPYPTHRADTGEKSRSDKLYTNDNSQDLNALRDEVLGWCRRWGVDDRIRIAVCGYEGDGYEALVLEGWEEYSWSASGGYGNQKKGKGKSENADRERIWFSPGCIRKVESNLFSVGGIC